MMIYTMICIMNAIYFSKPDRFENGWEEQSDQVKWIELLHLISTRIFSIEIFIFTAAYRCGGVALFLQ